MTTVVRPDWPGRLQRVRAEAITAGLDAFLISSPLNIYYLTGFNATAGLLVVTPQAATLLADGRYDVGARRWLSEAGPGASISVERVDQRYDLTLALVLGRLGGRLRVGFEAGHVTVSTLQSWQRGIEGVEWLATDEVVERGRIIKDAFEQQLYRNAGERLAAVARQLGQLATRGATERAVARAIDDALLDAGFSKPAFPTIVASGPNSALPHARPGERALAEGDLVVLDFGGALDGYCVDLTRTAAVGRASSRALELYASVRAAHGAAIAAVQPGVDASAIDAAARDVLDARGLGPAFSHGTGHGLGLEIHEAPRIARAGVGAPGRIEVGMVFTIEPGAYLEAVGGVRLEDDVLVTMAGCEVLTDAPRDLLIV
jgi:Xaa-Pro aminopeptidase